MSGMVTVAVTGDVAEAQEIRGVLERVGIDTELEGAETDVGGVPHDGPCRVLVRDDHAEAALDALTDAAEEEEADELA
jgi:hypothetical protein